VRNGKISVYILFVVPLQGDGGGPLTTIYCPRKLVGIVSYEWTCGNSYYPAVYTKVSAVRDWILNVCNAQTIPKGIIKADAKP
jgi:secreted trypsin-like serine protease